MVSAHLSSLAYPALSTVNLHVLMDCFCFVDTDTQNVNGLAEVFKTWSSVNTRYELASSRFNKLVTLVSGVLR